MRDFKKIRVHLTVLAVAIIVAFFPFNLTIAPGRNLHITTVKGDSVSGVLVRQIWKQYSLDVGGEEDFFLFNSDNISIPKRKIRTSIISLIGGAIEQLIKYGIHASFCSSEFIGIFAEGYKDKWIHNGGGLEKGKVALVKGENPVLKMRIDKYLMDECMKLKPGIRATDLTPIFGPPKLEIDSKKSFWLIFDKSLTESRQILARVNPNDGSVLELRCNKDEPSQWVVDGTKE